MYLFYGVLFELVILQAQSLRTHFPPECAKGCSYGLDINHTRTICACATFVSQCFLQCVIESHNSWFLFGEGNCPKRRYNIQSQIAKNQERDPWGSPCWGDGFPRDCNCDKGATNQRVCGCGTIYNTCFLDCARSMDQLESVHYVHRGKCLASLPGDSSPPDPPNFKPNFPSKTTEGIRGAPIRTKATTRLTTKRAQPTKKKCPPHRPKC